MQKKDKKNKNNPNHVFKRIFYYIFLKIFSKIIFIQWNKARIFFIRLRTLRAFNDKKKAKIISLFCSKQCDNYLQNSIVIKLINCTFSSKKGIDKFFQVIYYLIKCICSSRMLCFLFDLNLQLDVVNSI